MQTIAELEKKSRVAPKKFRVEDFRRMTEAGILPEESGWEIIDGYLIDKMTIGSRHASVVRRLSKILEREFGAVVQVSGHNPIQIDEYNQPEPGIALLKSRDDFYAASHPTPEDVLLLVEVSDSTGEYDRETKKELYAKAAIAEFWLVNLKENTVETYSSPKNGSYRLARILETGEAARSETIENLAVPVEDILGS